MRKLFISNIEDIIFTNKNIIITAFFVITLLFLYQLQFLKIDSGFHKLLPLNHEFMKTFVKYKEEFGGANRVLVAVLDNEDDMFNVEYFSALKDITDEIFFIPGIKRSQIYSLFTPNVRFTEIVEDGIKGGNVIPNDFQFDMASINTVKENIYKAKIIGRLVANDFSGSLVSAELQEFNPETGKKLNYSEISAQLEHSIREKYEAKYPNIDIHIIGFAKYIGEISDGAKHMIKYFILTVLILIFLLIYYSQSIVLGVLPLICSVIAVIWQLGMLPVIGYGMDPMSMLVPFLILAIGTSHGIQIINRIHNSIVVNLSLAEAVRKSFSLLFIPGLIALLSDTVGFFSIVFIDVGIIREMAITASIGVAIVILTNLILLPLLISKFSFAEKFKKTLVQRKSSIEFVWAQIAGVFNTRMSIYIVVLSLILLFLSLNQALQIKIGDQKPGAPELHENSSYNLDSRMIAERFSIGINLLNVIVETEAEACIDFDVMNNIDQFIWHMNSVPGVNRIDALSIQAKRVTTGWNEGYLKWNELPRNSVLMSQATAYIPTSTGLLNADCSVMPVQIFTQDHKQDTIERIVKAVQYFDDKYAMANTHYKLATGNVGVIAASNDEVKNAQFPILVYMFLAVLLLVYLGFRTWKSVFIILYPIVFVSIMTYAIMNYLDIGLKINTLPVVALGIGIGVDYGIYLYNSLLEEYTGNDLYKAYLKSFSSTGYSILFTGFALSIGVVTWLASPLKFQSDMGVLLVFIFFVNMLSSLLLVPALFNLIHKKDE